MPCPYHAQRRHDLVALVVLSALLAAPPVASEIVKCVAKDGSPLYQNFPCHIDSLGTLPSKPTVAKTPSTPGPSVAKTPSMPGAAGLEKSKSESVKVASSVKPTPANELRIGMTADEVRALLGEPEEMVEDEPPSGRVSIWRYADGRLVKFNNKHRVLAVQR